LHWIPDLRKTIYKHAVESKLLGMLGRAEMEKELQNTVGKIPLFTLQKM
jgi:hypothetical protein